jgi:hypothetical protein
MCSIEQVIVIADLQTEKLQHFKISLLRTQEVLSSPFTKYQHIFSQKKKSLDTMAIAGFTISASS